MRKAGRGIDTAVILAAGKSERLGAITQWIPKPMQRIRNQPILEHSIHVCRQHGVKRFFINLHHRPDVIKNYFGNGSRYGVSIRYKTEKKLLGTAGGVKNFSGVLKKNPFFVIYGDNWFDYDLRTMARFHKRRRSDFTMAVFHSNNTRASGVAVLEKSGAMASFVEKSPTGPKTGWVNAGVYLVNPGVLKYIPAGFSDFGRDVVPRLLEKKVRVFGLPMKRKVKAIDTPLLHARWVTKKKRAIFLDRDGILNKTRVVDGIPRPPKGARDLEILPGVAQALNRLRSKGFLLIVVTNQPDVGRGAQTRKNVALIHDKLQEILPLDDIYACFDENPLYKKPAPGMLLEAGKKWGIDFKRSYMVGDRWKDVEAGKAAGCKTVFVDYGYGEPLKSKPHAVAFSAADALKTILK